MNNALDIIDQAYREIEKLEKELATIGSLTENDRIEIKKELHYASSCLFDAKNAAKADEFDFFIMSFTEGILNIGRAFGKASQANEFSKLRSEYAKLRLKNDPKHFALKEIEQEYYKNKSQFKRYGFSAEFVRSMMEKYPIIKSQKTIENLVTKLNKKNQELPL